MDEFLIEHTSGPTWEVSPSVIEVRRALVRATRDLLAIPDSALEKPWPWLPGEEDADVRYAYYRCMEVIEHATANAARSLEEAGIRRTPASRLIAPATIARWELHGALAPLGDELLDADPGGGEWTIRQTLAHVVATQRAYAWFTAWWLRRTGVADFPKRVPEEVIAASGAPAEEREGEGSLAEVGKRFDDILDLGAGRLASLGDEDLAVRARWSGLPVTVGFRLGRWSSHIAEHTVQVDKTLAMLGRSPAEVDRLVRLIGSAYGRLEALVFGLPPEAVEGSAANGPVAGAFREAGEEMVRTGASARAAAAN
jgi:hypothetical protein